MTSDAPNGSLERLAALAGIEEGWWDFFGQYRHVSTETKQAFLTAMGFAVADEQEAAASLQELELRPWRRWLEPVLVFTEQEEPPVIVLTTGEADEALHIDWTLTEELGATHRGDAVVCALPVREERDLDGIRYRRHELRLPATPQPGVHALRLVSTDGRSATMTLIIAPTHAYMSPALHNSGRLWGIATQLYALRSEQDWGIGDFSDLAELGRRAAKLGASAIGVNPLHALFPCRPEKFSPYSPSGRRFLNVMALDVEAVPDFKDNLEARRLYASPGFQARLAAAQNAKLVDYLNVASLKFTVLESCWKIFRRDHLDNPDSQRGLAYRKFQTASGTAGQRFVTFEALQDHFLRQNQNLGYWRDWPEPFQNPDSPDVAAFATEQRERLEFFWYLQWLADQQLKAAQDACKAAGMPIGVYRDLGVGIADDGAEAWANQSLLCLGVAVGAPPDPLNLAGQDWGLAPFNPITLREAAYAPLLEVLEANMTHAGAMRLDHAMSLQRLYWVPCGVKADQGAYVRYPVEDLFALVALASRRRHCVVIGEDLGTVPDGFRDRMQQRAILGYRLAVFEKTDGGHRFKSPGEYLEQALAAFGTHDLPSLSGWWRGIDIDSRERLGIYPNPDMGPQERLDRAQDRSNLIRALAAEGLIEAEFPTDMTLSPDQLDRLSAAIHSFLGRTPAKLLMVQFEDVLGQTIQMNLPGTTDQHPNWRLRYGQSVEAMLADPRITTVATALAERAFR